MLYRTGALTPFQAPPKLPRLNQLAQGHFGGAHPYLIYEWFHRGEAWGPSNLRGHVLPGMCER
jgi:hypothetical protein